MSVCCRRALGPLKRGLICKRRLKSSLGSLSETVEEDETRQNYPRSVVDGYRSTSRRFVFENPGENLKNIAAYLRGDYQGWSAHFLPHLQINAWQRKAMFVAECEKAMFSQNPAHHDMEELGFSREFEIKEQIIKIEKQAPTDYVLFHDLREMWKRRQSMELPFVNVGSFVEVKCRSKWDLTRPVTYGGVVIEKEHTDLSAFFVIRKNISSYGYGVENVISMYSPFLESVKVISYQVRDDPSGTLQCLRDLTADQTELPDPLPSPTFDPVSNLEIPHFVPLRLEYKEEKRQKRFMQSTRHLRPRRKDTLRNYKLWESHPDKRHPRPNVKGRKYRE